MLATSLVTLLIPLWIILGIAFIVLVLGLLARIQNGRYLRPLVMLMAKVPLFKRWLERGHRAAIERTNPELASAMRKLEPHAKHLHDPQTAQKAMSRLRCRSSRAARSPRRRTARCAASSRSRGSAVSALHRAATDMRGRGTCASGKHSACARE